MCFSHAVSYGCKMLCTRSSCGLIHRVCQPVPRRCPGYRMDSQDSIWPCGFRCLSSEATDHLPVGQPCRGHIHRGLRSGTEAVSGAWGPILTPVPGLPGTPALRLPGLNMALWIPVHVSEALDHLPVGQPSHGHIHRGLRSGSVAVTGTWGPILTLPLRASCCPSQASCRRAARAPKGVSGEASPASRASPPW
jgi:hypothetical protein